MLKLSIHKIRTPSTYKGSRNFRACHELGNVAQERLTNHEHGATQPLLRKSLKFQYQVDSLEDDERDPLVNHDCAQYRVRMKGFELHI